MAELNNLAEKSGGQARHGLSWWRQEGKDGKWEGKTISQGGSDWAGRLRHGWAAVSVAYAALRPIAECGLILVLAFGASVRAAETNDVSELRHTFSAGINLTRGNSETMQANVSYTASFGDDNTGSARAGTEGNYARSLVSSNEETTVENVRFFASGRRMLSGRWGVGGNAAAFYDSVARIDYRFTVGIGAAFFVVKTDRSSLVLEAGPSYIWEEVADRRDDYLAARFSERFEHKFGTNGRVWQWAEHMPKSRDFTDYLANAEAGIESAMSSRLRLRVVFQEKYDSSPGSGMKHNDLALIAGISVSL